MSKKRSDPMYGLRRARNGSREFTDFTYLDKLSAEELSWLADFCREYYRADFPEGRRHIHPQEMRRDCYGMNNARWRDVWARWHRVCGDVADIIDGGHPATEDDQDDQ